MIGRWLRRRTESYRDRIVGVLETRALRTPDLRERVGGSYGRLYANLEAMEAAGIVESQIDYTNLRQRGGRPGTRWSLTPRMRRYLRMKRSDGTPGAEETRVSYRTARKFAEFQITRERARQSEPPAPDAS